MKSVHPRRRSVYALALAACAAGLLLLRTCGGTGQAPRPAPLPATPAMAPPTPAPQPPQPDAAARHSRDMPAHTHITALIFNASPAGIRLVERQENAGILKLFPAPDGRVGLYFRFKDKGGALICDGMLPDPFAVRAIPPRPGDAPLPGALPPGQDAAFSVRVPHVPGMGDLEIYHVPRTAQPADPRDRADWLLGRFPLSD